MREMNTIERVGAKDKEGESECVGLREREGNESMCDGERQRERERERR